MSVAFTTDHLDERDRIPFWVDVASKTFYAHSFSVADRNFTGHLKSGVLDDLFLTVCDCGPCTVTRSRRDTARDDVDSYILSIRLEGRSLFMQDDRTVVLEPGSVHFHTTGKPLKMQFLELTRSLHVTIPRRLIRPHIANPDAARLMSTDMPAVGLIADYVGALIGRVDKLDSVLRPRLAAQIVDLVSLTIGGEGGDAAPSTARAIALRRVKAEIEKRLTEPGLNPALAASGAGISIRYANALLAEEGTSLERYIQSRRLEQCRRALQDPLQSHRMIGEIAFAWGFSDHSHFTRRFRDAFGVTPSECREHVKPGMR